jgi:hypothetical protein
LIERSLTRTTGRPRPRRPLSSSPPDRHTGTGVAKFHDERDILETPLASGHRSIVRFGEADSEPAWGVEITFDAPASLSR